MSFLSKDIGIDLGTANTLVYMKGKGIIMREPSVVAVDTRNDEVRCVGTEAKAVIGRTPGSIVAVRPLKDGVIADFDITANMLENFLKKACGNSLFARPRVVICIPSGVTEVERRAVREATLKGHPQGRRPAGVGHRRADGRRHRRGAAHQRAHRQHDRRHRRRHRRDRRHLAGRHRGFPQRADGRRYVRPGHHRLHQAQVGSAYKLEEEMTMEIKGRNLVDGLPKNIVVHSEDVREALLECLVKITDAIKETLERTPPELSADIIDRGITLTGGGALLRGLDKLIQSETGIDVHVAEDPLDCVATGAGAVLDHVDVLHDVLDTDGDHM